MVHVVQVKDVADDAGSESADDGSNVKDPALGIEVGKDGDDQSPVGIEAASGVGAESDHDGGSGGADEFGLYNESLVKSVNKP